MIFTAYDTGISTGVARLDTLSQDIALSTLGFEALKKYADSPLVFSQQTVLMERLPKNSSPTLLVIQSFIETMVARNNMWYRFIAPAEWKPIAKARNWKCSIAKTQHEYDAYAILRYYFFCIGQDMGDL